jgi:hypothetical protein
MFFWNNEGLNPNAVVGSSRRDIQFSSVVSNGTTMVGVICPIPHGLSRLDVIAIYGLSNTNATGFYYISEIIDEYKFTYEILYPISGGPLQTENTTLFAASIGVPYGYIKVPYLSTACFPPVNIIAPIITGSCVSQGTWTGSEPIVYTYQWYSDGLEIQGATSPCYYGSESNLSVTVTGTNLCGTETVQVDSGPASWNTALYEFKYLPTFIDTESIRLGLQSNIYIFSMNRTSSPNYPVVTKFNFSSNQIIWNKRLGDGGGWSPDVMCSNPVNGNVYICTNYPYSTYFGIISIIDKDGNLISQKKAQGAYNNQFYGIYISKDNNYLVASGQTGNGYGLLKLDMSGNIVFSNLYYMSPSEYAYDCKASTSYSNDIYCTYKTEICVSFKINTTGIVSWSNRFNYSNESYSAESRYLCVDTNNNLIQAHNNSIVNGFCYLTKQSPNDGSIAWSLKITPNSGYGSVYIWDVTVDAQSNIYACGWVQENSSPYRRMSMVIKYDQNGNLLWCNGCYRDNYFGGELEFDGIQLYQDKVLSALWLSDGTGLSTASLTKLAQNGTGLGTAQDYLGRTIVYNDLSSSITSATTSEVTVSSVSLTASDSALSMTEHYSIFEDFPVNGFDVQEFVPPPMPL